MSYAQPTGVGNLQAFKDSRQNRQIQMMIDLLNSLTAQQNGLQVDTFTSEWKAVSTGNTLTIDHTLGRTPNLVNLEFSSDGTAIDGDCSWNNIGADVGCFVAGKDDQTITVQAGANFVGVKINASGVSTDQASGYVRAVAW